MHPPPTRRPRPATTPSRTSDEHSAVVALLRLTGLDAPGVADRTEHGDPGDLLAEELGHGATLLPGDPAPQLAAAASDLERWSRQGIHVVSVRDPAYPHPLRQVHDRPPLLFTTTPPPAAALEAVAVVGSRAPSEAGADLAARIARALVDAGYTVASGLATGIDTAAHTAAVDAGGRTIAVLPTGLAHPPYPPENATLQRRLADDPAHAVISPFWPDDGPAPERLRRRNGVMSGLSHATVIVEAGPRSGTRVQARLALGHGRPVILARAVLGNDWARELARRPNVHVIDSADELLALLRRLTDPTPPEQP